MKLLLSVLAIAGSIAVLATPQTALAAEVVDTYVKGSYNYTCIMKGDAKYCGNWNVASG